MIDFVQYKISLEDSTDRGLNSPTWGIMTASTFYVNVFLTQNIEDMGLFTDIDYISGPSPRQIPTGATPTDLATLRFIGSDVSNYYNFINAVITGTTDSKIDDLRSYNQQIPYIVGLNIETQAYINYENQPISGVSRVTSIVDPMVYVFDAPDDAYIGTDSQVSGLLYEDYSANTVVKIINGVPTTVPLANFRYIGEGYNETNTSLSALTKEEYLFGVVSPPEVKSGVFIDRGTTSVMDYHLRLSEIKSLGELASYGNGFYNLTRQ